MIDLQTLLFVLDECAVIALQTFPVGVQVGHGPIERQHAHILEQGGQKNFLGQRLMHGVGQRACCSRREQRAAPIQAIAQAVRGAAPQRLHQGKAQGEGERGIQAEYHQGLTQIFALAALRIQRRVGNAQHLGRQRRVHAQRLRDLAHFNVRILREFDDVRRHAGRRGKIYGLTKMSFDLGIHARDSNSQTGSKSVYGPVSVRAAENLSELG